MKSSHAAEETNEQENIFKSGPGVRIVASVHQIEDDESFNKVEFPVLGGGTRVLRIARELFRTPTKVADLLVKGGADLIEPVKAIKAACAKADVQRPPHLDVTLRTGWHGDSFVYPTETFGTLSSHLLYDGPNPINPALGIRDGTLAAWRDGLREPCKFSDYLLFTISVGPASCLLDVIGQDEGAIFHLHGTNPAKKTEKEKTRSTSGKTMATRAGISTVGRCRKTDLFSFAITERAIEDFCFSHNNLVVALDEEGRSSDGGSTTKVKTVKLPYIVPGGRGTIRSNKATRDSNLRNLCWALLALSTGENPLDGPYMQRPEGAQVRMIGIPVRPGKKGGIFNRVNGTADEVTDKCNQLARQVESTIADNYGVAMPEYLRKIVPRRSELRDRIRRIVDDFVRKVVGVGADPWERRFAEKFGIVLAGAIMMSELKIGPWTKKRARRAISNLYKVARSTTVTAGDAADAVLIRLRKLVSAGKRFPLVKKGSVLDESTSWGATRMQANGKQVVIVRLVRFEKLIVAPAMASPIIAELASRGVLIKGKDGKTTQQIMIGGISKRHRYVCLDRKSLLS